MKHILEKHITKHIYIVIFASVPYKKKEGTTHYVLIEVMHVTSPTMLKINF